MRPAMLAMGGDGCPYYEAACLTEEAPLATAALRNIGIGDHLACTQDDLGHWSVTHIRTGWTLIVKCYSASAADAEAAEHIRRHFTSAAQWMRLVDPIPRWKRR